MRLEAAERLKKAVYDVRAQVFNEEGKPGRPSRRRSLLLSE